MRKINQAGFFSGYLYVCWLSYWIIQFETNLLKSLKNHIQVLLKTKFKDSMNKVEALTQSILNSIATRKRSLENVLTL